MPAAICGPNSQRGPPITSAERLRQQLRQLGLSTGAIEAAWPRWWSEEAEESASARAELRFSVARRLGLDPASLLLQDDAPRFLWRQEARFKHLTAQTETEQAGIASFGRAVAAALTRVAGDEDSRGLLGASAEDVRSALTRGGEQPVDLMSLLALAWGVGIPVVHLRVFPWPQKRMAAMATRVQGRGVVLLAKDAPYPPWLAFYLAHELGHLAHGHVAEGRALIDFDQGEQGDEWASGDDAEEAEADAWAMEVLTGMPNPEITTAPNARRSAASLVQAAAGAGAGLNIDPGTVALAFGYSTGDWRTANGALKIMFTGDLRLPAAINQIAASQMDLAAAGEDTAEYLAGVLGLDEPQR